MFDENTLLFYCEAKRLLHTPHRNLQILLVFQSINPLFPSNPQVIQSSNVGMAECAERLNKLPHRAIAGCTNTPPTWAAPRLHLFPRLPKAIPGNNLAQPPAGNYGANSIPGKNLAHPPPSAAMTVQDQLRGGYH